MRKANCLLTPEESTNLIASLFSAQTHLGRIAEAAAKQLSELFAYRYPGDLFELRAFTDILTSIDTDPLPGGNTSEYHDRFRLVLQRWDTTLRDVGAKEALSISQKNGERLATLIGQLRTHQRPEEEYKKLLSYCMIYSDVVAAQRFERAIRFRS